MFLGYRNCSVNHFGSYVWNKAKTITQLKMSPVRFKAIHLPGNRQCRQVTKRHGAFSICWQISISSQSIFKALSMRPSDRFL